MFYHILVPYMLKELQLFWLELILNQSHVINAELKLKLKKFISEKARLKK